MTRNWQNSDWPDFKWDRTRIAPVEEKFLLGTGVLLGTIKHLGEDERTQLIVDVMSGEALTTSEIEGEILNRASVQSSIQRQLGLIGEKRRVPPREQGITEMMVNLFRSYDKPLSQKTLFGWHRMMLAGRKDLEDVGKFRTSREPMQVISGSIGDPKIHFEAPPSEQIPSEMERFVEWFNRTAPDGGEPLSALTRAGIAHLYFESIHPFEDGNGRIGRALSEKALAQSLGQPVFVALATGMLVHQKSYYEALEQANKQNEITAWLVWFGGIAVEAQQRTISQVEFLIRKTKLIDRLWGQINTRQRKALLRIFREGPDGFKGGLSASNYGVITGASPATTTRDLADLAEKGALVRTGERRHARYAIRF
jgi:Fic family protein